MGKGLKEEMKIALIYEKNNDIQTSFWEENKLISEKMN